MDYLVAFFTGLIDILPVTGQGQQSFLFMLVGIAIGFVVGILPGLGGAATLALMLPFIYKMDPTTAFAFLLGSNAVTATTGDITSVLFGVPGEGITAATIVDGHPMAKKGEAGRALGAALMSSLVGAVFGAFALALAFALDQVTGKTFRFHHRFWFQMGGLCECFFNRTQNQLQQEIGHDQLVAQIEEALLLLVFREEA